MRPGRPMPLPPQVPPLRLTTNPNVRPPGGFTPLTLTPALRTPQSDTPPPDGLHRPDRCPVPLPVPLHYGAFDSNTALPAEAEQAFHAVTGMIQALGYPFAPLRSLVGVDFRLSATDPEWLEVKDRTPHSLDNRIHHLRHQADTLLHALADSPSRPPID